MNATNKATAAGCAVPIGLAIKQPLLEPNATEHQLACPNGFDGMPLRGATDLEDKAEIFHCFLSSCSSLVAFGL